MHDVYGYLVSLLPIYSLLPYSAVFPAVIYLPDHRDCWDIYAEAEESCDLSLVIYARAFTSNLCHAVVDR